MKTMEQEFNDKLEEKQLIIDELITKNSELQEIIDVILNGGTE